MSNQRFRRSEPTRPRPLAAVSEGGISQPSEVRNTTDPGDATGRNFRYQHAYGVMLLVAAKRGLRPYVAIWCEQHEDFLAERADGIFNGYQIKTARPELGAWTLKDRELIKSIGRFIDLVAEFGDRIGQLFFVSNTEFDEVTVASRDEKRRGRCPSHSSSMSGAASRETTSRRRSTELLMNFRPRAAATLDSSSPSFTVWTLSSDRHAASLMPRSRTNISRSLMIAGTSSARQLDSFRDELVALVHRASSLQVTDPVRHLRPLIDAKEANPELAAKRILVAEVVINRERTPENPGLSIPGAPILELGDRLSTSVIAQKLNAAGLGDEIDYLRDRALAAEYNLLEDVARRPEAFPALLRQIEQRVHGELVEAHLHARQRPTPYGQAMLIEVQDRLRRLAEDRSADVGHHSYDCLMGVAGLLTSECRVWWGPRFPISVEAV